MGSQAKLARVVKVSQPSVWGILARQSKIPAEWCIPIEKATGGKVTKSELRPDLFARSAS